MPSTVLGSTENLKSVQSWEAYYLHAGRKYLQWLDHKAPSTKLSHRAKMLRKHLSHVVSWAIDCREEHVRWSGARIGFQGGTTLAGLIPGGKMVVKPSSTAAFELYVLKAFALDKHQLGELIELMWETAVNAGLIETKPAKMFWNETKSLLKKAALAGAKHWWKDEGANRLYRGLASQIGADGAGEYMAELMHFKPVVGQVASAAIGYRSASKTVNQLLVTITSKARKIHREILVFAVTYKVDVGFMLLPLTYIFSCLCRARPTISQTWQNTIRTANVTYRRCKDLGHLDSVRLSSKERDLCGEQLISGISEFEYIPKREREMDRYFENVVFPPSSAFIPYTAPLRAMRTKNHDAGAYYYT